jgi:bifunctional non-homologous end joining protein LigD
MLRSLPSYTQRHITCNTTEELKYDGWRALAYIQAGQCRLVSRKRNQFKQFQSLCADIAATVSGTAVLDGEIACLDSDGKPQFYELMRRRMAPTYCAFDVLWLNGRDLRSNPLVERKTILKRLVRPPLLYVDHMHRRGVDLFNAACGEDLEGVVAKLANGIYEPTATTWVKIKNRTYSQAEGREEFF